MAFTVHQVPQDTYSLARSPLIVVAGDSAVSDENYRVVVDVYAWEGDQSTPPADPIATLDKVQNDDGLAKFNIAPIIEDLFVPNDPRENTDIAPSGAGMCYNVSLDIGWSNGGATTIVLGTTVIKVTSGYALYPDDINTFDQEANYEGSQFALTRRPTSPVIVSGQPAWLNVFWKGNASADSIGVTYSGTSSGGSPVTQGVSFSAGGGILPTDSEDFLVRFRVDSTQFETYGIDSTQECALSINQQVSGTYQDWVFNFTQENCLIGADCIGFVNRFGVWDWLHVYAAQKKGIKTNRIEYTSRVSTFNGSNEVDYDRYNPSRKVLRTNAVEQYEVNTGWITEDHNDVIADLMASKIWYGFNEGKALILVDNNVQYKYDFETELINYTFKFEVANSFIQNIQ